MITFQNQNEFLLDKLEERDKTVSTFLIPEELMPSFRFLLREYENNINYYLRELLYKYRTLTHSGLIPKPIKVKTEYQEKDQNLHRVGFRPNNADWAELGELALGFGKSRCWLFVYLLKLDVMGLWNLLVRAGLNFAVPTLPSLELQSFRILQRVQENFTRSYHVKV